MCYTTTKKIKISVGELHVNWITFASEKHRST